MLDLQVDATYKEFFFGGGSVTLLQKKNRMLDLRVEAKCRELASQKTAGRFCDPQVSSDLRVEATNGEVASQTSDDLMDLCGGPGSADLGAGPAGGGRSSLLHGQLASQTSASTLWVLAKRSRTRDYRTLGLLESRMQAVSGQISLTTLLLRSSLRPHTVAPRAAWRLLQVRYLYLLL
jgi:hypothetical protein